jgi:sugar phosphate isomerase/epimerase
MMGAYDSNYTSSPEKWRFNMKLGCGLYGVAIYAKQDFWPAVEKLSGMGFTAVEPLVINAGMPHENGKFEEWMKLLVWEAGKVKEYRQKLEGMGLAVSSMHVVGITPEQSADEAARQLLGIAEATGVNNFMVSLQFKDLEGCEKSAAWINGVNGALLGHGVRLGYHNHETEEAPVEIGGVKKTLMDHFVDITEPFVKLQLDAGWMLYGGQDPVEFMKRYPDRICSIHYKDIVSNHSELERDKIFAATGNGILDCAAILELALKMDIIDHGIMIDQDMPAAGSDLLCDLKLGADYLLSAYSKIK